MADIPLLNQDPELIENIPLLNQDQKSIEQNPIETINSFITKLEEGIRPVFELSGHKHQIRCLSLSSDLLATGSADKSINLWQLSTKTLLTKFFHDDWVVSVGFTKDSKTLISGSGDGILKYWDLNDYSEILSVKAHEKTIVCMAVTDEYLVTGSGDKTAKLWNLKTKEHKFSFTGHTEFVYCLTVSKDGTILFTGSRDYSIKVWSITNRSLEYTLLGHKHWLYCISLSNDEKFLVSGSEDKTIRIWNLAERAEKFVIKAHAYTVTSVAVTSDDKYIISGSDTFLKVWGVEDQKEVFSLPSHEGFVRCLTTTPDRKFIISAGDDSMTKFWDISDKQEEFRLEGHTGTISSLDCSGELLVSASEDKTWRLWNYKTRTLLHHFTGHTDRIFDVCFSFDGKQIASCSADRTVKFWDIESQSEKPSVECGRWLRCILWKNDGNKNSEFLYSGCDDNLIYVINVNEKFIVTKLNGHKNAVYCLAMSEDRKTLYSGSSDTTIIAWDINSSNILFTLSGHSEAVTGLSFDSEGSKLVSGSLDTTIKIWNLSLKREEFTLTGHEQWISSICLSPITGLIYTSSEDRTFKAWNIKEKREEYSIYTNSSLVSICTNGSLVFTGSSDKSIKAWELFQPDSENLVALPFQSQFDYTTVVCRFNSTQSTLNSAQACLPLGKHRFTLLHLFAHQGKEEQLAIILASQPKVLTDGYEKSPLYYSLKKQSQLCTDMLLKYLIQASESSEKYLNEAFALRGDIIDLFYNSSDLLDEFLTSLLIIQSKSFGQPAETLAIVRRVPIQKVYPADFTIEKSEDPSQKRNNKEFLLQFQTTGFELPEVLGSKESLSFLRALLSCSNKKIFQSTLIQYYVRSKWNDLWYGALAYTLLLWGNLIVILIFTTSHAFSIWIQAIFIILNILLITAEIIQLGNASFIEYFSSLWNWIDVLRFINCSLWLGLKYADINITEITWFMIFLNFLKGVTGFRAFDRTRFYVRLFFRSFQDISFFLMIFFYSTIGFGLLFVSNKDLSGADIIKYLWVSPFDLNLGSFDNAHSLNLDYLGFFMASIVNVIVLLSLLVSILGDSFDRFRIEAVEIDHIEMSELVYELELLLFWRKNSNKSSYLQICDTLHMSYSIDDWEGTTKAIQANLSKAFDKRLKIVEDGIEDRNRKLLSNIRSLENTMKANIDGLNRKMNQILNILNNRSS